MKLLLFSIAAMAVLGGLAFASFALASPSCTPPEMYDEYVSCTIDKPVAPMVGDEIMVNCTKSNKEAGRWVRRPMTSATVYVTGYDPYDYEVVEYYQSKTGRDGTFVFKPNVAAYYGIQVGKFITNLSIEENPVLDSGTFIDPGPTGGVVAPAEEPPKAKPPAVEKLECEAPVLEFAIGKKTDNKKADASGLMTVITKLLIS